MFNNTSKILQSEAADSFAYVILPYSDKRLTLADIDKKIAKAKGHISHLEGSLQHRNTHGGKKFRSKNLSIKDQIDSASNRIKLLESARNLIPSPPLPQELKIHSRETTPVEEMLDMAIGERINSVATRTLAELGRLFERYGFF